MVKIHEMERTERSHLLMSALSKYLPVSFYFMDVNGRFVWISEAKAKNHGLSIEDIIGKTDFDLMVKEEAERSWADNCRVMATKESICKKIEAITTSDGKIKYVSVTKTPWLDDQGEILGVIGCSTDVTHIVQFLKIASHDIRSPLIGIGTDVKLLLRGTFGKFGESVKKTLENIRNQILKMERIIKDYISSSMLENYEIPEKEQLDLRLDIIDPILEEFAAEIEAREITIDNSLGSIPSGEIITMNTNRTFLYIIYHNLLENSVRFTPQKGIIAIGFEKQEKFIKLNVWNNGFPVESGKEEEIFKLNFSHGSTGLGLYVCRDLVEKLGGKMWYENSSDGYPNFLFTIPL